MATLCDFQINSKEKVLHPFFTDPDCVSEDKSAYARNGGDPYFRISKNARIYLFPITVGFQITQPKFGIAKIATCSLCTRNREKMTLYMIWAILDMKSTRWNFYFLHAVSQRLYLAISGGLVS